MTLWQALFLGVVQGLTEFLPVSSSAHLIVVPKLLGWADQGLSFDVAAHLGTFLAVLIYFGRDLLALVGGFLRALRGSQAPADRQAWRLSWMLVWGTAPLARGLDRYAAARLSFLLFVPASMLVAAKHVLDLSTGKVPTAELLPMGVGFLASLVAGYLVIGWLLGWIRSHSLAPFGWYRV